MKRCRFIGGQTIGHRDEADNVYFIVDGGGCDTIASMSANAFQRILNNRSGIASGIGTHREAVTRELNALARDGLIERRHGAFVIADVARLAQLVETGLDE